MHLCLSGVLVSTWNLMNAAVTHHASLHGRATIQPRNKGRCKWIPLITTFWTLFITDCHVWTVKLLTSHAHTIMHLSQVLNLTRERKPLHENIETTSHTVRHSTLIQPLSYRSYSYSVANLLRAYQEPLASSQVQAGTKIF